MKNSLVIQSGGPTSVINSSLYGIIKEMKKNSNSIIYGSKNGIYGLINANLINLNTIDDSSLELLKQTCGAFLGSARLKLSDDFNDENYQNILKNIAKFDIGYIFTIGGNDSMDTANKLNKFFNEFNIDCKVLGVPKTIDNDLINTDHTPGYGSALKYINSTLSCIYNDIKCYKNGKVTIVEIMGRDTGWLTAGASLCGKVDLIYLPESSFNIDTFLNDIKKIYEEKKYALVCVSEGIIIDDDSSLEKDAFGHAQLGGVSKTLENIVKDKLHLPTRSIELNLMQRCSSFINSKTDVNEAINCSKFAVKSILKGKSGYMISMNRDKDYHIKYELKELNNIANSIKYFPSNWIINNNNISEDFKNYAFPLIKGELNIKYENGIIKLLELERI